MKGQWYKRLWPWIIVSTTVHLVFFGTIYRPAATVDKADVLYEVTLLYKEPSPVSTGPPAQDEAEPPEEAFSEVEEETPEIGVEEISEADILSEQEEVTEVTEPERKKNDPVDHRQYGTTGNTVQEVRKEQQPPEMAPVIEGLRRRIEEALIYPYVARKRGLQGVVCLTLKLDERGNLIELKVTESSGYGVLDNAAAQLVEKVVPYPHGLGTPLSIDIPIRYSLMN